MENNEIEVSVVLPCLDEEDGIRICLKKIKEVFAKEKINGEIVVADNGSTDHSREVAQSLGARVICAEPRGYGAAYLCGLKQAQGKYIVIGDADDTYDFYEIPKFLKPLREGYDLVLGSRFKGKMRKGAMSWSHRYVGNPILSAMTRLFFHTRLSDIHCGMRAFTDSAYKKMRLMSLGMEFATEMVVAAVQKNLKICEVPINYRRRQGESKLKPFSDAWRHIRFMLLYCPAWLYLIPGAIGFISGMFFLLILLRGPFLFLGHYWDIHFMVFSSMVAIFSYQILHLGIYAHSFAIGEKLLKNDLLTLSFQHYFNLERGLIIGAILFLAGLVINLLIFFEWFAKNFGSLYRIRESIFAMTLMVIGLQTIFSSFFISLLFIKRKHEDTGS